MKLKPLKYLSQKVAVVYGTESPLAALLCLKLLQRGARLLLIHEEDSADVSLDLNLIWGGLDANYCSERFTDPWGAKAVAAHLTQKQGLNDEKRTMQCCMEFFGKGPDFVVDVNGSLNTKNALRLLRTSLEMELLCIQPLSDGSLFGQGWLGAAESENLDPEPKLDVSVFTACPVQVIKALNPSQAFQQLCERTTHSNSDEILLCKTDDLVTTLAYVLHGGLYVKRSAFHVVDGEESQPTDDVCRLSISSINARSLGVKQKGEIGDGRTSGLELQRCDKQTEIELDQELDGYLSSDSDLLNNGTFDAVLQKTKDYPVDWWQGGADCLVSVDDINLKAITRAAVNFTVRWLVLGYFVLGFAVPRALGWEGT